MPDRSTAVRNALLHLVRGAVYLIPAVALVLGGELFFPRSVYPHVVWKHFVFRILVEVLVGLWAVLAWIDPRYRPRSSWVLWSSSVFVAVVTLADLAGAHPWHSVWSNHERMEGLVGLLHLFGFFVVAGSVLEGAVAWRRFFAVSLAVSAVVCVDAVRQVWLALRLQDGLHDQVPFLQEVPVSAVRNGYLRADARIGSPVFLGAYLMLHAFLAALVWMQTRSRRLRAWLAALVALQVIVLYATGTRVAYLGLAAGAGLGVAIVALGSADGVVRRRAWLAAGAVAALLVAVAALVWIDPPFARDVPVLRRLTSSEVLDAVSTRLAVWEAAWRAFLDHPILGWGQENFSYPFERYFHPSLFGREIATWWDHPHNVLLGWLVAGGLLALLSYVAVLLAAFAAVWKRPARSLAERAVLTGLLASYLVFNGAQLDNLTSYVVFFAVLGYLHATSIDRPAPVARPRRPAALAAALAAALSGVGLVVWRVNAVNIGPAVELQRAFARPVQTGPGGRPELTIRGALGGAIGRLEVRELVALHAAQAVTTRGLDRAIVEEVVALALRELRAVIEDDPESVRARFQLGVLLNRIGHHQQAARCLEAARELAPRRQILCFELAEAYLGLRRTADAAAMYRAARDLHPASREARILCAIGALRAGDRALEDEVLDSMRQRQGRAVFVPPQRVVDALLAQRRADRVIELLAPVFEARAAPAQPPSAVVRQRFGSLAMAYRMQGQRDRAAEVLRALR